MTTQYICDRCGEVMTHPSVTLTVERLVMTMGDFTGERHLCPTCDRKFVEWFLPPAGD